MAQTSPQSNVNLALTGSAAKPIFIVGRKPFFSSPKEMEQVIRSYFDSCEQGNVLPTIPGLAYHLGFQDRQSVYDYARKEAYAVTIKRARIFVEHVTLDWACNGKGNVSALIFSLKCSLGYIEPRDNGPDSDTQVTVTVKHTRLARPDDAPAMPRQGK